VTNLRQSYEELMTYLGVWGMWLLCKLGHRHYNS